MGRRTVLTEVEAKLRLREEHEGMKQDEVGMTRKVRSSVRKSRDVSNMR